MYSPPPNCFPQGQWHIFQFAFKHALNASSIELIAPTRLVTEPIEAGCNVVERIAGLETVHDKGNDISVALARASPVNDRSRSGHLSHHIRISWRSWPIFRDCALPHEKGCNGLTTPRRSPQCLIPGVVKASSNKCESSALFMQSQCKRR